MLIDRGLHGSLQIACLGADSGQQDWYMRSQLAHRGRVGRIGRADHETERSVAVPGECAARNVEEQGLRDGAIGDSEILHLACAWIARLAQHEHASIRVLEEWSE